MILNSIALVLLIGLLFLARFIHVWVYVGVYSIIVVGGIIVLFRYKKKPND